jgi:hypothetical protein
MQKPKLEKFEETQINFIWGKQYKLGEQKTKMNKKY